MPAGWARRHLDRRNEIMHTNLSPLLKILGILDLLIKLILMILR